MYQYEDKIYEEVYLRFCLRAHDEVMWESGV